MHLVRSLRHQWRVLLAELTKFGVIGVINTLLDFAVFNLLHFGLHVGPLTSKCVSTTISATGSYFMNRHWTFKHRARTAMHREYSLFFLLNLVGLAIGLACIGATRYGLGLTSVAALNAANFVGLVLGTLFRFWSYRRWVFLADGGPAFDESTGLPSERTEHRPIEVDVRSPEHETGYRPRYEPGYEPAYEYRDEPDPAGR